MSDDDWLDLDMDLGIDEDPNPTREGARELDAEVRVGKARMRQMTRRAASEEAMNAVLDWHLEQGTTYHIMSAGDVDSLTYLRGIVKQQRLRYCLISTWVMAMTDAEEIAGWVRRGDVGRVDFYVGEIFAGAYGDIMEYLVDEVCPLTGGRVCLTRNHAKVMVGYGERFDFAITSSANINTNPRIENTCIHVDHPGDTSVADFYKGFFDDLKPFNHWSTPWEPWRPDDGTS